MDAPDLHVRKLNAKEVFTPMKNENFIFPIADGTAKISGGDQDLRTSTFIKDNPNKGEDRTRQGCQGPHQRECTGYLYSTLWKNKLKMKKTIRVKMDSKKQRKGESRKIKHTT